MDDACEKPREANCETKGLVFSDEEEHDLLDHMVKNRRLKKKEQALEAPPRPLRPRFRKKSTSTSTTETM